jgi:hypothetical protein
MARCRHEATVDAVRWHARRCTLYVGAELHGAPAGGQVQHHVPRTRRHTNDMLHEMERPQVAAYSVRCGGRRRCRSLVLQEKVRVKLMVMAGGIRCL